MKAERQQKERTSRVIQPSKGGGGRIVDNRPISIVQNKLLKGISQNTGISWKGDVLQRMQWTKVDGKLKVYDKGAIRDAIEEKEEIDTPPPSGYSLGWRPGCVWDDQVKKWYKINTSTNDLDPWDPSGKLEIIKGPVSKYDDGVGKNFGHIFNFTVWMDGFDIKWKEKTDKPYIAVPGTGIWTDLYPGYKDSSDVFKNAKTLSSYDREYIFQDPPGIFHEPSNKRKLEFELDFEDKSHVKESLKAEQNLETDSSGDITRQEFNWI